MEIKKPLEFHNGKGLINSAIIFECYYIDCCYIMILFYCSGYFSFATSLMRVASK